MSEVALPVDTPWKRLHAATIPVNLVPRAWAFLMAWWPILAVAFVTNGGGLNAETFADMFMLSFFALGAVGNTVVHFLTLRYRMHEGRLEIRSGLLNRNKRVVPPSKVQNVEMVRNIFHRLSGLVEVRIETASGGEIEGMLSALSVEEATALVNALKQGAEAVHPDAPPGPVIYRNSIVDLITYGATSTRIGGLIVAGFLAFEAITAVDPQNVIDVAMFSADLSWMVTLLGFLVMAIVGWFISIGRTLIRHHGFTLQLERDRLVAQEGLFTSRRVELPVHKVQLVSIQEPFLRRLLGFGSVVIETAAARSGAAGTTRALSMVPVVRRHDVDTLVRHALPQLDLPLNATNLHRASPRALKRGIIRAGIQGFVLSAAAIVWWGPWGGLAAGCIPVFAWLAWLDWRHQRWAITDTVVLSRRGYLRRTTQVVSRDKLQSVDVDQGPLQRRYRLGEVQLRVAGSRIAMPLIDHEQAYQIASMLIGAVARPRPAPAVVPSPTGPPTPERP